MLQSSSFASSASSPYQQQQERRQRRRTHSAMSLHNSLPNCNCCRCCCLILLLVLLLICGCTTVQSFTTIATTTTRRASATRTTTTMRTRKLSFPSIRRSHDAVVDDPGDGDTAAAAAAVAVPTTIKAMTKDTDDDSAAPAPAAVVPETERDPLQLNIAFVTGNQMKVREFEMILSEHMARAYSQSMMTNQGEGGPAAAPVENLAFNVRIINVDLPEIQEVSTEAIAKEKALLAAQLAGGPCLVEDTSLQFHALGGMPGPYIKWFQDTLKSEGLYNILMAYSDKSATACCTLAFCPAPHADPILFTGKTVGTIVAPVVGGGGFGWDSIFVPNGSTVPFASMTTKQKNESSHRGKAVRQWAQWVSANRQELFERQEGRPAIGHKGLDFKCISPEQ